MKSRTLRIAALLICALPTLLLTGCTRIGPGHVGIVVSMAGSDKGVLNQATSTGWVFYNPMSSNVIEYPTNMQTVIWTKSTDEGKPVDESITFTNKDQLTINADFSINYSLRADSAPAFYVKFLANDISNWSDGYLRSVARNCVNDVAGNYPIEQIMGDNAEFLNKATECIGNIVGPYGINVDKHGFGFIGAPRPPEAVLANINSKIQATQLAMQKQNELLQVQADAAKQVAAAEGQAKAQIASATGEAEANRLRTASITPVILQNKALDNQAAAIYRWNGTMPSTVVNSGGADGGKTILFNIPAGK
jgi:regulator of protease activity HflC (stomatin/prohibitin superfamily)